jgi:hypothetical protein
MASQDPNQGRSEDNPDWMKTGEPSIQQPEASSGHAQSANSSVQTPADIEKPHFQGKEFCTQGTPLLQPTSATLRTHSQPYATVLQAAEGPEPMQLDHHSNNPYVLQEGSTLAPISTKALGEVLRSLPAPPSTLPPGRRLKAFHLDTCLLGMQTGELNSVGVILFTPGFNPSCNSVERWNDQVLEKKFSVKVVQTRVLAESTFLLVLDSSASR